MQQADHFTSYLLMTISLEQRSMLSFVEDARIYALDPGVQSSKEV